MCCSLFVFVLFCEKSLPPTLGTEQLGGTADTTKKRKAGSRGKRKVKKTPRCRRRQAYEQTVLHVRSAISCISMS